MDSKKKPTHSDTESLFKSEFCSCRVVSDSGLKALCSIEGLESWVLAFEYSRATSSSELKTLDAMQAILSLRSGFKAVLRRERKYKQFL